MASLLVAFDLLIRIISCPPPHSQCLIYGCRLSVNSVRPASVLHLSAGFFRTARCSSGRLLARLISAGSPWPRLAAPPLYEGTLWETLSWPSGRPVAAACSRRLLTSRVADDLQDHLLSLQTPSSFLLFSNLHDHVTSFISGRSTQPAEGRTPRRPNQCEGSQL